MPDLVVCPNPDCDAPAEIVDRWTFPSTHGPVAHVKTVCSNGHSLTPLVETVQLVPVLDPSDHPRVTARAPR
jgi:hypothetical protein